MAKVAGGLTILFAILIIIVGGGVGAGIYFLVDRYLGRTWADVGFALYVSFFVGWGAFDIICPKKKRGVAASRITAVVALLAYSSGLMASSLKYLTPPSLQFSLNRFLLEGVLVGAITMGIIYGIAQAIHWAIKGKWM